MNLYNKGGRTINPNTNQAIPPGKWKDVPDEEAKKLLRMFPRDLTAVDPGAPSSEQIAAEKENAELKAKLAAAEAKIANLEKLVAASVPDPVAPTVVEPPPPPPQPDAPKGKKR